MATTRYKFIKFLSSYQQINKSISIPVRLFHVSSLQSAGRRWREEHRRQGNWTASGVLTDTPDWSYSDGRPGCLNYAQKRRLLVQQDYAKKIEQLLWEVDYAVEKHDRNTKMTEEERRLTLARQPRAKVLPRKFKESLKGGKEKETEKE